MTARKSIVADRLSPFVGKQIAVRVTYSEGSDVVGELAAVLPIGSEYFLQVHSGKQHRLINVRAVLEIGETVS